MFNHSKWTCEITETSRNFGDSSSNKVKNIIIPSLRPQLNEITTETKMSFESYTQHMPTLQRTTFWSNYMAGLKGNNEMLIRDT